MEALVHHRKKFSINFSKANTKLCLSLHYNADNSYLFVNGKDSLSLKPTIKTLTFQPNLVSEAYLMDLALLSLEKYLGNVYDFSVITILLRNLTY